jgi:type IV pilus assembly protein PilO
MALADLSKSLQEIQLSDLTLENIGSWPMPVKAGAWVLAFAAACFLGYNQHLKDMQAEHDQVRTSEAELRTQFEAKDYQVANLDALRAQLKEMEEQFGALLSQLPKDSTDTFSPELPRYLYSMGIFFCSTISLMYTYI